MSPYTQYPSPHYLSPLALRGASAYDMFSSSPMYHSSSGDFILVIEVVVYSEPDRNWGQVRALSCASRISLQKPEVMPDLVILAGYTNVSSHPRGSSVIKRRSKVNTLTIAAAS
jgi:hypothetical protein